MYDSAEEDISLTYTTQQYVVQKAFEGGYLRIIDSNGHYKVEAVVYHQNGNIEFKKGSHI